MATDAQSATNIRTIRDNLITELNTEVALWAAGTPKVSYSLDGQSVSWNEWLANRTDQIEKLTKLIQVVEGAWIVTSRAST